jgi:predicted transcriptional regulator
MTLTDHEKSVLRPIWREALTGRELVAALPERELHEIYAACLLVAGVLAGLLERGLVARDKDGRWSVPAEAKLRLREEAKQEERI